MKILIPTNLYSNSQKAADFAIDCFGEGAKYCLLNSFPLVYKSGFYSSFSNFTPGIDEIPHERLKREKKRLQSKFGDVKIKLRSRYGEPIKDLFEAADAFGANLIVMGHSQFSTWNEGMNYRSNQKLEDLPVPIILLPDDYTTQVIKRINYVTDLSGIALTEALMLIRYIARLTSSEIDVYAFDDENDERSMEKWMIDRYLQKIEHNIYSIRANNNGILTVGNALDKSTSFLTVIDIDQNKNELSDSLNSFLTNNGITTPLLLMPKKYAEKVMKGA